MTVENRVVTVTLLVAGIFLSAPTTRAQLPIFQPSPAEHVSWEDKGEARVVVQELDDGGLLVAVGADIARVDLRAATLTPLNAPGVGMVARWLLALVDLRVATLTRLNAPDVGMVARWLLPLGEGRLLAIGASGQALLGGPKATHRRPLRHLGALRRLSVFAAGVEDGAVMLASKEAVVRLSDGLVPSPVLEWPGEVDAVVWCPAGPTAVHTGSFSPDEPLEIMTADLQAGIVRTRALSAVDSADLSSDFLSEAKISSMICDEDRLVALMHHEEIFGLLNVDEEMATLRRLEAPAPLRERGELASLVWLLGPHLQLLDLKEKRIILWPVDEAGALGAAVEIATPGVRPVLPRCLLPSGDKEPLCAYVAADAKGAEALFLSTPKGALPLKPGAEEPFFDGVGWDAHHIYTLVRDPLLVPDERLERALEAYCEDEPPVCEALPGALTPWFRGFAIVEKQGKIAFRIDHCTLLFDLITKDKMKISNINCSEPVPCGHKMIKALKAALKTQASDLKLEQEAERAISGLDKSKCCQFSSYISEDKCHEHIIEGSWFPLGEIPIGFLLRIDNSGGSSDCSDIVMQWTGSAWWLRTTNVISCD